METSEKIVFVTVGTTEFDSLIKAVCSEDTCKVLKMLGYTKLLLQIGRGEFQPKGEQLLEGFQVEFYRYKKSLKDDIDSASLVISHAGAGSVLETLGSNKPLLVVINDSLMDNHQLEVANQLYCDGHLYFCTTKTLGKTLEEEDFTKLKPFKTADPSLFASFVDSVMGFT